MMKNIDERGSLLHIAIVIVSIVLIFSGLAYLYLKNSNTTVNNSKSTSNNNSNWNNLNDPELKTTLNAKVRYLSAKSSGGDFAINGLYIKKHISDLTQYEKLHVALLSLYSDDSFLATSSSVAPEIDNEKYADSLKDSMSINLSEVTVRYSSLFGKNISNYSDVMESTCPGFLIDSKNSKYYLWSQCGGTGVADYLYVNKVYDDSKNVYANVSVGYATDDGVYDGYDTKKKIDVPYGGIDSKNYTMFSQYKFTFTKNSDGKYIFSSIDHIED